MVRPATCRTVLVALSAALLACPVARAQEGWEPATAALSAIATTGGAIHGPRVAVDPGGNATAIWWQSSGTSGVVQSARRAAGAGAWSAARTISATGQIRPGDWPLVVVDADGDATAVWQFVASGQFTVFTARYDSSSDTWAAAEMRSSTQATGALGIAGNADGDVMLVWGESTQIISALFSHTTDTWSATIPIASETPLDLTTAIDAAGNAITTWQASLGSPIRVARYGALAASWSAPTDLTGAVVGGGPRVVVNGAGDAALWWLRANNTIEAVTSAAGSGTWSAPVTLAADGSFNLGARGVVDVDGNVVVAWVHTEGVTQTLRTARYTKATTSWSAGADLPSSAFAYGPPAVGADAAGNVFVVWSRSIASPGIRLLAARYARSAGTWTVTTDLSTIGHSAFNPSVGVDSAGNAIAVWFQSAGGVSANFALRWRATLAPPTITGGSPATGAITLNLQGAGSVESALAPTNVEYSLDDGATWTPRAPAHPSSPLTIGGLTDGTLYTVRLRTVNAAGRGSASAGVALRSGTAAAPANLRLATRAGNRVTLAWHAPAAGLLPNGYLLEGGIAGQGQVLVALPTGGAATQITLDVPDGWFFVQVSGTWNGARLATSTPFILVVNASPSPTPPAALLGSAVGSALTLTWRNTWDGETPTGLRLAVTGSLAASFDLPLSEAFTFPSVPPGTYTFTLTGLAGAVAGVPSIPVTLTFPGTCAGPPLPPVAFSASTQGGSVFLDWLPPASGEAITGYLVSVIGAFTGAFPMTARTLAAPVPPGQYAISVASVGPCGTSAATAPQTVVVP